MGVGEVDHAVVDHVVVDHAAVLRDGAGRLGLVEKVAAQEVKLRLNQVSCLRYFPLQIFMSPFKGAQAQTTDGNRSTCQEVLTTLAHTDQLLGRKDFTRTLTFTTINMEDDRARGKLRLILATLFTQVAIYDAAVITVVRGMTRMIVIGERLLNRLISTTNYQVSDVTMKQMHKQ